MPRAAPVLTLTALISAASSGCQVLQPAAQSCAKEAAALDGAVAGAFDTSLGAARVIARRSVAPDPWPGVPDSFPVVVCYIDGNIAAVHEGEPYDRAIVAVVNGQGYLIGTGYRSRLPVKAPSDQSGS